MKNKKNKKDFLDNKNIVQNNKNKIFKNYKILKKNRINKNKYKLKFNKKYAIFKLNKLVNYK